MTDETPMKRCSKCKEWYPATSEHFGVDKRNSTGLRAQCRICLRADGRRYSKTEQGKATAKRQRNTEKRKAYLRDYAGRAEVKLYQRNYRQSEFVRARQKRYVQSEKGRIRGITANRKRAARKLLLPHSWSSADWLNALEYFDYRCAACGRPAGLWHSLAADHWIPLTDPRPDNPGTVPINILPLCHSKKGGVQGCNNTKHNQDPLKWLFENFPQKQAKVILQRIEAYFASLQPGL